MSLPRFSIQSTLIVGLFAFLWLILWQQLSGEWSVNDQYSYGWFVPFFTIVLFWLRWEDAPMAQSKKDGVENRKRIVAIGIAVIGLLLLFPIRLFEIGNPDWRPLSWLHAICVVVITLIFLWWIGGTPWLKHFAFPVAFTLVAVPWISPIEAPVIQGLMRIIALVAAETANLLGIPAQVQGNLIQVRTGLIGVNEACSGVRSLQTALMIGLLFGELRRLSVSRRVILVFGAIAIALVANLGRAVFLVSIGAEEGIPAIERWHDVAGYGIVACVFVGTLLAATLLSRRQKTKVRSQWSAETSNKEPITDNSAASRRFAIRNSQFAIAAVALAWLAAVEFGAAAWYRAHEKNVVVMPRWTFQWPNDAPSFRETKIDEGVRSTLRYDQAGEAAWNVTLQKSAPENDNNAIPARCISFFFRWKPGGSSVVRARAHRPDICLPAAGWRQVADRGVKNYPVRGDLVLPFHHLVFEDRRGGVRAHTFFCLQEDELRPAEPRPDLEVSGGAQPDWSLRGRSRVVFNGVRNLGQQILEVGLLSSNQLDDATAEKEFAALVPNIIKVKSDK